ncbi:MAG: DUF2946 domain-containing protein [Rhodoferax sp.]|nr:DUF2946 domain-containing protein [Rhodoferax sp.]
MHLESLRRPWAVWLAVLLVLFGAFAPTLSHGIGLAQAAGQWPADICVSPASMAVADNTLADSPDGRESAVSSPHCPFCLLSTHGFGPPATASAHPFASESGLDRPVESALFFESRVAWLALPRGPPAINCL